MLKEPEEFIKVNIEQEFSTSILNYNFQDLYHDLSNCFASMKANAYERGHKLKYSDVFISIRDEGYDDDSDFVINDPDFVIKLEARFKIRNDNYEQEMIEYYEVRKRELEEAEREKKKDNISKIGNEARREYKKSSSENRLAQRVSSILSASISDGGKLEELKRLVEMNR